MSYQVIARKWRPETFNEVTGQEHITRMLQNAIANNRLHHAYLFSGSRGVGKTTTARLLAKAVNCHNSDRPTIKPCTSTTNSICASCLEISESRSIDVLEIDAASNTGVGNIRDSIIDMIEVSHARDRYKVFIIDEVHMLSASAFNALLKTLEEPPPNTLFVLATTHAFKIPITITSRTQQFEFRSISTEKISERLRLIAVAENIEITDDAIREISRSGEGSMRDAQSAFDQVISFSEGEITISDVESALGIAGFKILDRVMQAVADKDPAEMLEITEELTFKGYELLAFSRDLLAHIRNLLVFKIAANTQLNNFTGEEREVLVRSVENFSESDLIRFFHSLTATENQLRNSLHPRYQFEIGLVKLVEMRRLANLDSIIERLIAIESVLKTPQPMVM